MSDGSCEQHTAWLKCCVLSFLKAIPSHPCFVARCLDGPFPVTFSTPFPTLAPSPMTTPSLLHPSASSTTATPQGGLLFGRLAEQSPLTGYERKSLIEVSSEHTPIFLPSRKGTLDTNLAIMVHASERINTTDGTVDSTTFFSQEREVSAISFSVSGSQTHSSVERPMRHTDLFSSIGKPVRDVESFSCFEKPLSKGKRNRV